MSNGNKYKAPDEPLVKPLAAENLLTLAEYARRHRVSRQCVARWRDRGHLSMAGDLVDATASDAKLAERPRFYRGGKCLGPSGGTISPPHPHNGMSSDDEEI